MSHKPLIILTLALTLLVGFDYLNAWTAPASGNPPTGDVAAPINTGSATQNKSGTLGVNALAVFGNSSFSGAAEVSNSGPLIKFNDTTALTSISRDFWLHANNSTFYLLADRDNANNTWESPHPLEISASADGTADYARFPNQVRAGTYCDVNGANCHTSAEMAAVVAGPSCTQVGWEAGFELTPAERPDGNRYMIAAESASYRCKELGYDFGFSDKVFAPKNGSQGWCGFVNARTAQFEWDKKDGDKWISEGCANYSVAVATCCSL